MRRPRAAAAALLLAAHGAWAAGEKIGTVDTAFHADKGPEVRERISAGIPMGRFGKPEEMAPALHRSAVYMGNSLSPEESPGARTRRRVVFCTFSVRN